MLYLVDRCSEICEDLPVRLYLGEKAFVRLLVLVRMRVYYAYKFSHHVRKFVRQFTAELCEGAVKVIARLSFQYSHLFVGVCFFVNAHAASSRVMRHQCGKQYVP